MTVKQQTVKEQVNDLLYQYLIASSTRHIADIDLLQMDKDAIIKYVNQDYDYWTNRFVKVFEKLIDEKIADYEKHKVPHDYNGRMPTFINGIYLQALEELKEDLIK